ncbi:hypothetical protein J5N97_009987 [Dioscorea zingiberensis]|uniref:Uncharacterized protein n=1 Tax=Dioscorea zingiberensis TaxID=325984 RepID=A0A9D5CZU0_9LILI|nr:hypothetical protein J5N97_009987 [Dioscorea zingiberensis]
MSIFRSSREREPCLAVLFCIGSSLPVAFFLFPALLIAFKKARRHSPAGSRTTASTTKSRSPQGQQQHTTAQPAVVAPASSPNRVLGLFAGAAFATTRETAELEME